MRIVLNDSIRVGKILFEKGDILSIPDRSQKELEENTVVKLAGKGNYLITEDTELPARELKENQEEIVQIGNKFVRIQRNSKIRLENKIEKIKRKEWI